MVQDDHRWLLTTGRFSDFLICCEDFVDLNVHKLILSLHSDYFAQRFQDESVKGSNACIISLDVEARDMNILLDFFYRGTTPWKRPDDMFSLARLWILADKLKVTNAKIDIEEHVKSKLEQFDKKWLIADEDMLNLVFSHKACAESGMGYVVGEAAWTVLANPKIPKDTELVKKLSQEHNNLANMMLFWSSHYMRSCEQYTGNVWRNAKGQGVRDNLMSEKMTKPSDIMTSGKGATEDEKKPEES
ncbi:hypothetical protein GCG54_00009362 [Colletotrichum gloeosporioides]|uniref:BTB domain-containing protein n=1 Tax=Colletotrichum gloeosporioides TaxID=474922 RepID=A0A8H4FCW0_COLGL|nr:uncharacterized protein GCG54_00009362 [Colletotrichum gloeosporioides]KAF3797390.1 hypothetical protein GCG54_00009362 [Colletotrichum gloeosporioides]